VLPGVEATAGAGASGVIGEVGAAIGDSGVGAIGLA